MVRIAAFDLIGAIADLGCNEERAVSEHIVALDAAHLVTLVLQLVRVD